MKKKWMILIVVGIILAIIVVGYFSYMQINLRKDYSWCMYDSHCKVYFSSCSCDTYCGNLYSGGADCLRECPEEQAKSSVKNCECRENKCVPLL
jgi:hypothetical protein